MMRIVCKRYCSRLCQVVASEMEKKSRSRSRRLSFGATPIIFLLALPFFCVAADFLWGNKIPFDRWVQYFSSPETRSSFSIGDKATINKTLEELEFMKFHISRLVRGDDRTTLDVTGFACDKSVHSIVCVSNKHATIDTTEDDMTVYVPSSDHDHPSQRETVIRPYAKQENELPEISPVHILQYTNTTTPPPCHHRHTVPAVIFSSGSTGNVFHEMNEIIIPLFITTNHFRSRVLFVLEDYKPSFVSKYGKILSRLSAHDVINPSANRSVHCFPSTVVGLRYHDNLALDPAEIPGGYSMPDFKDFLRQVYGLRFAHVSQTPKRPRLMLLSRTNTRRFLNEDEMRAAMEGLGFEVVVVRRSRVISDLNRFSKLINSCSVLVGAHGAGLTNEIFLPSGAVMVQVELLGTGWASDTYYGDTARAMGVRYLRYKIEAEESSLSKLYGRNHSVLTDPGSVYRGGGYRAARTVYLDQQNVRVNVDRFRETLVEALSLVTDWDA